MPPRSELPLLAKRRHCAPDKLVSYFTNRTSAPTQTDGSGWSEASRRSAGQLGESPVCICALGWMVSRVGKGAVFNDPSKGTWLGYGLGN